MVTDEQIKKVQKLFDTEDLSDIKEKDKVKIGKGKQDVFGQQLIELFIKAKDAGIEKLNVNQVTVAYYRCFVENGDCKVKTNIQIMNKLFAMAAGDKYPLEKVEGEQGTYRLK
jgi:hypothetical protein